MTKTRMFVVVALIVGSTQLASGQELSRRDTLRISAQQICPVSGQKLGAHGTPLKVQVGKETVFLCCQGCLKGKINTQHWDSIHASLASAQGMCPVMDRPLPKSPKWIIVEGQIIYVCCPPCTTKIAADPSTYLRKVDELYANSLQAGQLPR